MLIDDVLNRARLQALFANPTGDPINFAQQAVSSSDPNNPAGNDPSSGSPANSGAVFSAQATPPPPVTQYYSPHTEMSDALLKQMGSYPSRSNYAEPSTWTKIRASLASLAARNPEEQIQIQDQIRNPQFYRDMQDWSGKAGVLEKGASLERQDNSNERLFATAAGKETLDQKKIDISQQRADAYVWHQTHPNHQIKEDANGNLIGIDPTTNDAQVIVDKTGNPIKSSVLPDEQKLILGMKNKLTEIDETGDQNRKTVDERGDQSRKTKQTPGAPQAAKPPSAELPNQTRTRLYSKAQQAVNEHPEWSKYITLGTGGQFTITPPKSGWFGNGLDQKTHDAIYSYIYGGSSSDSNSNSSKPSGAKIISITPIKKQDDDE